VTVEEEKSSKTTSDYDMMTDLARVLRLKNIKLKFIIMILESQVNVIKSQAKRILKIFKITTFNSLNNCELEYIERDEIMHINRLVKVNDMNIDLHAKISLQKHKIIEFEQSSSLKLIIAILSLLDSLQFIENTDCMKSLEAYEVKLEVKFVEVNFMNCLIVLKRVKKSTLNDEFADIMTRVREFDCDLQSDDRVCKEMLSYFKMYT